MMVALVDLFTFFMDNHFGGIISEFENYTILFCCIVRKIFRANQENFFASPGASKILFLQRCKGTDFS